MPKPSLADELKRYGPQAPGRPTPTAHQARRYCRRLARRHYENFTLASWLLPGELRPHFYNLYAYCRWADDLADETGDPARSLDLLGWWERQLHRAYDGRATHPVFVALAETTREFEIPLEPLADLLIAFRQDQTVTRYDSFDDLLGYCRNSANPVGRLVLYLGRCHREETVALSDAICTGLQLANFWQDLAGDWRRGRVYLPRQDMERFGYDETALGQARCDSSFRELMAFQTDRAEQWLRRGLPLVDILPQALRFDVALFVHGGLAILDAIRGRRYDVWRVRPKVGKGRKLSILVQSWRRLHGGNSSAEVSP